MSRAGRLLSLVQQLRRYREPVTARELADTLGVSVRSIYRDIDVLRAEGADVAGEAGVGYVLRPGFLLPPLMFRDEELEALVLGLRMTSAHGDAALAVAAGDVLAKLRAVLPRDVDSLLDESPMLVAPPPAPVPVTVPLDEVRRAIREQKKARIAYSDGKGRPTERTIWPIGLGFHERIRIVVAWCELRRDFRAFRADRIASLRVLADRLPRRRAVLLAEWRRKEGFDHDPPATAARS